MGLRRGLVARRAVRRWSRRLLRREWRQQVLVIGLLTWAVAAAVFAATAAYNAAPSSEAADFGSADLRFQYTVSEPDAVQPYVESARRWFGTVEVIRRRAVPIPGSTATVEVRSHESNNPFTGPMLEVRSGRTPRAPNEVALTDEAASQVGAEPGRVVRLGRDRFTVVGLVENPADLDDEFALVPASAAGVPEELTVLARGDDARAHAFHPTREPGNGYFETRDESESTTAALLVLVVASVAMVLVSLVAGAAFITLAHRRQRQLGLLAAVGATTRQLRRAMVANGAAVGAVAAVLGTVVALVGWLVAAPSLEAPAGKRIDRFDIPLWVPVCGMVLAVLTASLAAWWPSRAIARVPVTEAISARPSRPRAVRRPLIVAVLLFAVGIAGIAFGIDPNSDEQSVPLFLGGLVAIVAATVLLAAPTLRAVARGAGRLPITVRLAMRDLARFQARSAAALGAISLGLAIAVAVVVIAAAAVPGADRGNLSDRQLMAWTSAPGDFGDLMIPADPATDDAPMEAAVAEMAASIGATAVPLDVAVDPAEPAVEGGRTLLPTAHLGRPVGGGTVRDMGMMFVATPAVLAHLGIDPAAVKGELVLTPYRGETYIAGISNRRYRQDPVPDEQLAHIDVGEHTSTPRHLITDRGLDAADLRAVRAGWLLEASHPLTAADTERIRAIASEAGLAVESRDEKASLTTVRTAATVAGLLVALCILAMTLGLLRADAAHDVELLTAAGATSRTRRGLTASTAGALAAVGVLLGTVMAYAALIAGYWPETDRLGNVPLAHLIALAVGLPVVATSVGWLAAGRAPASLHTPTG